MLLLGFHCRRISKWTVLLSKVCFVNWKIYLSSLSIALLFVKLLLLLLLLLICLLLLLLLLLLSSSSVILSSLSHHHHHFHCYHYYGCYYHKYYIFIITVLSFVSIMTFIIIYLYVGFLLVNRRKAPGPYRVLVNPERWRRSSGLAARDADYFLHPTGGDDGLDQSYQNSEIN